MSIDTVNQTMREGMEYSVEQISNALGISKSYAGTCLRGLFRGG